MILSDEHRYVFVQLPRTGSTAIARELCQRYGGRRVLQKHSTYRDFLAVATPEQRQYFVFSSIRNPLDDAVSRYFKYVTDHHQRYSGRSKGKASRLVRLQDRLVWHWRSPREMSFSDFFLKAYIVPYDNWASEAHQTFDAVIRFEQLADDFDAALRRIGLTPVRRLPVRNATAERSSDFTSYYTPRAIARAKRVFAPFMTRFGYEFPSDWGETSVPWWSDLGFRVFGIVRRVYWRYLRYRI